MCLGLGPVPWPHLLQGLLEPHGGSRSSGVGMVAIGWKGPRVQEPLSLALAVLYLIPLDEAALVLVQGLEGLADDAVQLP